MITTSKYRAFKTDRTTHQNPRNRVFGQFLCAVTQYDAKKPGF